MLAWENAGLNPLPQYLPFWFVFLLREWQRREYLITFIFFKFDLKNIEKITFDFSCLCKLIKGENAGVLLIPDSESNLLKLGNYLMHFSG